MVYNINNIIILIKKHYFGVMVLRLVLNSIEKDKPVAYEVPPPALLQSHNYGTNRSRITMRSTLNSEQKSWNGRSSLVGL